MAGRIIALGDHGLGIGVGDLRHAAGRVVLGLRGVGDMPRSRRSREVPNWLLPRNLSRYWIAL
jgi:hypothetical protein